jgi:hypothetical protein
MLSRDAVPQSSPNDPNAYRPAEPATLVELAAAAERERYAPERLHTELAGLLVEPEAAERVVKESIYHPNGFAKIVLGPGRRLHVWPTENRRPEAAEAPHGHRWAFASWIVAGELRETSFVRAPSGDEFDVYEYGRTEGGSVLTPTGTTHRLVAQTPVVRTAGNVYTRSPGELHTAEPADADFVASLVIQGPLAALTTSAYRRPGVEPTDGRPLPPDDFRSFLEIIVGVLQPVR